MVKISDTQGRTDYAMVLEDPRPNNDGFYLQGTKVDKTSMTPQYERTLNYNAKTDWDGWQYRVPGLRVNWSNKGAHLALSKTTGSMSNWTSDGDAEINFPCSNSWTFMEPEIQSPTIYDWVQDGKHQVMHGWQLNNYEYAAAWAPSTDSVDLDQVYANALGTSGTAASNIIYSGNVQYYP